MSDRYEEQIRRWLTDEEIEKTVKSGAALLRRVAEEAQEKPDLEVSACHRQLGEYIEAVQIAEEKCDKAESELSAAREQQTRKPGCSCSAKALRKGMQSIWCNVCTGREVLPEEIQLGTPQPCAVCGYTAWRLSDQQLKEGMEGKVPRVEPECVVCAAREQMRRLREALAETLEHVEMQNCDVIGAVQQARAALAETAQEEGKK